MDPSSVITFTPEGTPTQTTSVRKSHAWNIKWVLKMPKMTVA
jgi:hypothetical protein